MPEVSEKSKGVFGKMAGLFSGQSADSIGVNSSSSELLSGIYKILVQIEEFRKKEYDDNLNQDKDREKEEQKRHKEILKALTFKRPVKKTKPKIEEDKVKPKQKPVDKTKTETQPTTKAESKVESTTPKAEPPKVEPTKTTTKTEAPKAEAPKTAVPVAKPAATPAPSSTPIPAVQAPAISTAVKVGGAAITGITISNVAKASTKGEQNVSTVEEALKPVTDEKVAKRTGVPIGVAKIGAATPDLQNSTSYGLFGINNIRAKDKKGDIIPGSSSIDTFTKMFPNFGLPDAGSPNEPEKTKKFNEAWWNLAKTKPEEMLKAQLEWFNKTFEEPSRNALTKNLPKNIAEDPGVQLFMADRRIQYGPNIANNAFVIGKNAKTPEEFIRIVADNDRKNLRNYFSRTSQEQYNKIERGLQNRIDHRLKMSLEVLNTGSEIDKVSSENKMMKKELDNESVMPQTTNNVTVNNSGTTKTPANKVDDRSAFDRKRTE